MRRPHEACPMLVGGAWPFRFIPVRMNMDIHGDNRLHQQLLKTAMCAAYNASTFLQLTRFFRSPSRTGAQVYSACGEGADGGLP